MTNKEIEKRFLFDLEMKLFKLDKTGYIWLTATNKHEYNSICELLNYTGFTNLNCSTKNLGYKLEKVVYIRIGRNPKEYIVHAIDVELNDLITIISNPIPDYIKEYSIYENW